MENAIKHRVDIPFIEALEKMSVYAKFVKSILNEKRKPKYEENITLTEKCSITIQRKLPPQLKDT